METIAVYWEPKIKTYGLKDVSGLTMIQLKIRTDQLETWGHIIGGTSNTELLFKLVLLQYTHAHELRITLLFEANQEEDIRTYINHIIGQNKDEALETRSPVEMIYFFGPHFGDRYGIAEAAVSVLHDESISILAMGCSVSFIYIILPEGAAFKAKSLLAKKFEIP